MNQSSRRTICLLQLLIASGCILQSAAVSTAENPSEINLATPLLVPTERTLSKSSKKADATSTKNICLEKEDKYRTCFTRAADPSNDLEEDTILRDEYNMAAAPSPKSGKGRRHLAKASKSKGGKTGSKSAKSTLVEPYTPPYVAEDEILTEGTIYLSMVKEQAETRMSCDDKLELEEATIEWLYDNLGSKRTFTPLCAFNDGYEFHEETVINADGKEETIATAAFKMDLVFATKKDFDPEPSSRLLFDHRRLKCSQKNLQTCCSADSINKSMSQEEIDAFKQYCVDLGCKPSKCPKKKKKKKMTSLRLLQSETQRFSIEEDLLDTNFKDVLGKYTDLAPVETGALLDATSLDDLTICRANNYNVAENDEPILTCEEYEEADCKTNDYLIIDANATETFPPTFSPSVVPTSPLPTPQLDIASIGSPTYFPSYVPTAAPSLGAGSSKPGVCIEDDDE